MTKTAATVELEDALDERARTRREYGCREVTIGFSYENYGDEIVDYLTMDAHAVFKCYELKVSLSDLKSDNAKSWYGDYNYLVVSESLYARSPVWGNYIPPYAGILSGPSLTVRRTAKKKGISSEQREMLKDSLLRSVYWKMKNFEDAGDLEKYRKLEKELEQEKALLFAEQQKNDELTWTYHDYEHYYRKNHSSPSFTIADAAKQERKEYAQRTAQGYSWIRNDRDEIVCPHCGHTASEKNGSFELTPFCPFCGSDLRNLK
jgi:rubrerythrin